MSDFVVRARQGSLSVKLMRGERMCLLGMDVADPEPDFVGFSIEVKPPGAADYVALCNRLNFSYPANSPGVTGARNYPSISAPFQKFRWLHFPDAEVTAGDLYSYRVAKIHMDAGGVLRTGDAVQDLAIELSSQCYDGYLQLGFTRNFASSQAYDQRYGANAKIIPATAVPAIGFKKLDSDVYAWLGFTAYDLIFSVLEEVKADPSLSIDVFAYDFDEPDVIAALVACGARVRAVIDDSDKHGLPGSTETWAAGQLTGAGAQVKRMHFTTLQHNKVLIVRKDGAPCKVLFGSTNFSFRGLYIQANNALVFHSPDAAALYAKAFELAFQGLSAFDADPLRAAWHDVAPPGAPPARFCFSPHAGSQMSLQPVGDAIVGAKSSVFFAIAFLNQIRSGPVHDAVDGLMTRDLFSYGVVDRDSGLEVRKPDGSVGLVDFNYLGAHAPPPFQAEWSGGAGIHQHDKFVVVDFDTPDAKVFTGSSNLSNAGETGNGDNLVMICDPRVATAYAIEAVRVFDHLEFRSRMAAAPVSNDPLTLQGPPAAGAAAWFAPFYVAGSQKARDRQLFSA